MNNQPRILFICDFPPSDHRGGAILLNRLFSEYPADHVAVLAGSHYTNLAPTESRLSCRHFIFPTTNKTGRWGLGRFKTVIDSLMLAFVAVWGFSIVRRSRAEAIVAVAHGLFFFVAGLLSRITQLPLILIVHDDWVATWSREYRPLRPLFQNLFGHVARQAAHVYVVSPQMRDLLHSEFGVHAEFELPGTSPIEREQSGNESAENRHTLDIIYAGTLTGAMDDALSVLLQLVSSERLLHLGVSEWMLHLYTPNPPDEALERSPHIRFHGWVSATELRIAMRKASVLFLPLSFRADQRAITETSFPSKTADYLAANTPVLICAPESCALARYARQYGCAEVVSDLSEETLGRALSRLANSPELRARLREGAKIAFAKNHDVRVQREHFFGLVGALAESHAAHREFSRTATP
jgi:glycosyltransferase involved in cell wall biosynthesis